MPLIQLLICDSVSSFELRCISTIEEISEVIKRASQVPEPTLERRNRSHAYNAWIQTVSCWAAHSATVAALIIAAKPMLFVPFLEPTLDLDFDVRCTLRVSDGQWAFEIPDDDKMLHDFDFDPGCVFLGKYPVECGVQVAEFI